MKLRGTVGGAVLTVVLGLAAVGCGDDSEASESGDIRIGVVNLTAASVATNTAAEAIEMGGEHLGWDVEVGDGEGDPAKISQIMQTFVNDGVDAIFTLSIEAPMIAPQLDAARKADIPVIAAVYAADEATEDQFSAVYSPDYVEVGEALGQAAIDAGIEPGTMLVQTFPSATIEGFIGGAMSHLEEAGFDPVEAEVDVKNYGPSIQSTARTLLQSEPDAEVFLGGLTGSTSAVLQILAETKRDNVTILGVFDMPDMLDAVRKGEPVILVAPDYARSAFVGLDQLRSHFEDGTEIDREAGEGTYTYEVVTADNVPAEGAVFPTEEIAEEFYAAWDDK